MKIRIATRESRLAMWQAEHVQDCLQKLGHSVQLVPMTTRGDQILDRTLSKVGGKGLSQGLPAGPVLHLAAQFERLPKCRFRSSFFEHDFLLGLRKQAVEILIEQLKILLFHG